ncbi:MAG: hypothetical protein EON55_27605 [Alphaproteobacteria bacterium]|nr:MAG: hypothetical protein EON55_27605 [Alphaproteobacteria bacterium]
MAFALLEASLQSLSTTDDRRPRRPDTVVQTLAMLGLIDADKEVRLRTLAELRNRIVHGDLTQRVGRDDVRWMLLTIRGMLNAKK